MRQPYRLSDAIYRPLLIIWIIIPNTWLSYVKLYEIRGEKNFTETTFTRKDLKNNDDSAYVFSTQLILMITQKMFWISWIPINEQCFDGNYIFFKSIFFYWLWLKCWITRLPSFWVRRWDLLIAKHCLNSETRRATIRIHL